MLTRLLRSIFALSMAVAGFTVLALCRALIDPSATWAEFLTHLKGILTIAAIVVPFVFGPALFLLFAQKVWVANLKTTLGNLFLSTRGRSVVTCVFVILFDLSGLLAARAVTKRPTKFDEVLERCQVDAFRFETATADACLTSAELDGTTE